MSELKKTGIDFIDNRMSRIKESNEKWMTEEAREGLKVCPDEVRLRS